MRVPSRDGSWVIDVIHLTLTNHHDGDWLRVSRWGWHVAHVRTAEELASLVDLAELDKV